MELLQLLGNRIVFTSILQASYNRRGVHTINLHITQFIIWVRLKAVIMFGVLPNRSWKWGEISKHNVSPESLSGFVASFNGCLYLVIFRIVLEYFHQHVLYFNAELTGMQASELISAIHLPCQGIYKGIRRPFCNQNSKNAWEMQFLT